MLIGLSAIGVVWGGSLLYIAAVVWHERKAKPDPFTFPAEWCTQNDRDPSLNPDKVEEARVARQEHDNR